MDKLNNKWTRAAIPALLIHISIGSVYCWSLIKTHIANYIGLPKNEVEWAFSLAIFFLGMSAAFAGRFVERDIHKSSMVAAIFFASGMALTGFFIIQKSLIGILISYGLIMGIGLGIGYLSPVKTLMLWFKDQKGLATGLAVAGFGLAKVVASPVIEILLGPTNADKTLINPERLPQMLFILAAVYFVSMFLGHLMLKKPDNWVEPAANKADGNMLHIFKNKTFIGIWVMFYINITCGLTLISQEKDLLLSIGFGAVGMVSSLTAIFNSGGRITLSALADRLRDRNTIYKLIFTMAIGFTVLCLVTNSIQNGIAIIVIALLCAVNAGYGGGFSNLPTLLHDRFGMTNVSTIHGLALSAWAFAGLSGNQLSAFIIKTTNSFNNVLLVTAGLYSVALLVSWFVVKEGIIEPENISKESGNQKKGTIHRPRFQNN